MQKQKEKGLQINNDRILHVFQRNNVKTVTAIIAKGKIARFKAHTQRDKLTLTFIHVYRIERYNCKIHYAQTHIPTLTHLRITIQLINECKQYQRDYRQCDRCISLTRKFLHVRIFHFFSS